MKKIKIKVKNLILLILCSLFLLFFILPYGILGAAEHLKEKKPETAKVLYKKYLSIFPYKKEYALYELATTIAPVNDNNFIIYFSSNMRSGMINVTRKMSENAIMYYEKIIDRHSNSEYYEKAYQNLLYLYTANMKINKGNELIDIGLKSKNMNVYKTALKYKMFYLACYGDTNSAKNIANEFLKNKKDSEIYSALGDIYVIEKNFKEAKKYYDKALDFQELSSEVKQNPFYFEISHQSLMGKKDLPPKLIKRYNGNGVIKGRVTKDNIPIPFSIVVLKDSHFGSLSSSGDEDNYIFAFTNYKGEYQFTNIPNGTYATELLIPSTVVEDSVIQGQKNEYIIIDKNVSNEITYNYSFVKPFKVLSPVGKVKPQNGKVNVRWEKVPGAKYYNFMLTIPDNPIEKAVSNSTSLAINKEEIRENEYTVDINKVNIMNYGYSINSNGIKSPSVYLGAFAYGGRTPFYVEAYDDYGRRISSSVPTLVKINDMSYISMEDYKIDNGENLIINGKLKEAASYYEEKLKKNPKDIKSLEILSRIYLYGFKEDINNRDRPPIGYDFDKYIECTKKLYTYTNDADYIRAALNSCFYESGNKKKYSNVLIDLLKEIPESYMEFWDYDNIAQLHINAGDYGLAKKSLDKMLTLPSHKEYYNVNAFVLNMYLEDFITADKFLNLIKFDSYKINRYTLVDRLSKIKYIDKKSDDYKRFKLCLKLILETDKKEFVKEYKKISNKNMLDILNELAKYSWDMSIAN